MHRVLPAFRPIAFRLMILFGAHRRRRLSSVMSRVQNWKCFVELRISYKPIILGFCVNYIPGPTTKHGVN